MTAIVQLFSLPLVHALGWTLLHFCWQGALVGIGLACALDFLPSRASRLRHTIACAAMALMVLLTASTFCMLATNKQPTPQRFAITTVDERISHARNNSFDHPAESLTIRLERVLDQSLPTVIGCWFAGVLVMLCRLNLGFLVVRRMKSLVLESAPAEIQQMLRGLRTRLGIQRTVMLLNSARVQTPTVIGWLKPAILLPIGCVTGLSTLQIEAILAHELAHIRRHDYLVSLFQSVMETVFFYHPAVWWVSNKIRCEREHCCDDLAVAICGDGIAYARALSFLEERRNPALAGAFNVTGGELKMRIARLLNLNQSPVSRRTPAVILLVLAAVIAGLAAWGSAPAQSTAAQQPAALQQGSVPMPPINSHSAVSRADTSVQVHSLTTHSADLPESDRRQIVQAFQGKIYSIEERFWMRISRYMWDHGYMVCEVTTEVWQPASGQQTPSIDVTVSIHAGHKYALAGFSIEGAQAFSQNEIIKQFPLQPGDLFNQTAIETGFRHLLQLYGSKGYVNVGMSSPEQKYDDVRHTVTVILRIKEGTPLKHG
jgi:beta-lactamase regulating signal transducer with metallopeptidase domain